MGAMGVNHARILHGLEDVDFIGFFDSFNSKIYNDFTRFNTYTELLKSNLDYCVIAAPTHAHKELAIQAIDFGVSILIEKPLAPNYHDACAIRDHSVKNQIKVGIGHIERYNAAIQQLKLKLERSELGKIYQISTRRQGPFPSRITDVGVVKDLATHDIDLTSWITMSSYESVYAQTAHKSGREHEDLVSVIGRLENGIIVNHNINWLSPLKERKVMVTGEKGTYVVDILRSDLTFYANGTSLVSQPVIAHFSGMTQGDVIQYSFDKPEPLLVEHVNFRDSLLGLNGKIVSVSEGCEIVRVADSILQSSQKNEVIHL
jgi:predicted dehydrogenase